MTRQSNRRVRGDGIAIAGGGLAGQRCAETLRRAGYERAIRLVCSEPRRPYDRPPLSKELLTDTAYDAELPYRSAEWYREQAVDLLIGVSAMGLDPATRRLALSNGSSLRFEKLLIATGGRPRTLPILAGYDNVSVLRTFDDARVLREVLASNARLAVIGAGFIGLEIAATARRLGVEVTLVEAASCPLIGVLGAELGGWFARLHEAEGVDVRTEVTVDRVSSNGSVRALRLSDSSVIAVDHVVVGTGIVPDVGWLTGSGLEISHGVPVDVHGRTAVEHVFRRRRCGGDVRRELWPPCPRIALGGGGASGRARCSRDARTRSRRRAVDELLDRPVRTADPVRRPEPRRELNRDRRRSRDSQLQRDLLPRRTSSCRPAGRPASLPPGGT